MIRGKRIRKENAKEKREKTKGKFKFNESKQFRCAIK
jgi:hypothetical protein